MEQLQTEHGVFTNNEDAGKTAKEVYDDWLSDRGRMPNHSFEGVQIGYNVELDHRLSKIEMGL